MPSINNKQQNKDIASIKTDVSWLKERISKIEDHVFNHLPSKIDDLENRLTLGLIIGIITFIIVQILSKLF